MYNSDNRTTNNIISTAGNSACWKSASQWLIEVLCFVSGSVVADSFRLRIRQLPVAANRCGTRKVEFINE